jgi:hypothetical protein
MSFWKHAPGPTWWDCIESFNPCIQTPYGLCNSNLELRKCRGSLSKAFSVLPLSTRHASDIQQLLKQHFSIFPTCRITLTKERIRQGFQTDNWIGVGVFTADKLLIGCCISKPLGRMKFAHETLNQGGIVDYFCVHQDYRKLGIASYMLDELVILTAKQERLVHIFLKEGFPLLSLPPLYTGRYLVRKKNTTLLGDEKEHLGSLGIAFHSHIQEYSHAEYLPLSRFVANLPWELSGDSELFVFNYKGHVVFLCVTDIHHRTVPEGLKVGEIAWVLPQTIEVPLSIQRLAVETCVDSSRFDILLLDSKLPHDPKRWQKDASFSWYIFNYNPGGYFSMKPFWIL